MKKSIAIFCLLSASPVNAAIISDLQTQTVTAQLFTHNLVGLPSDGSGGILTAHVRGDFNTEGSFNENFDISIEGNILGSSLGHNSFGAYDFIQHSFNDREFSIDFNLSSSLLSSVLSDSLATVTVDFGTGTNIFDSNSFSEVTLNYNVANSDPEPETFLLLGYGAICFIGMKKKSSKVSALL